MSEAELSLPGMSAEQMRFATVFFEEAVSKTVLAYRRKSRFVHYTTAETAMRIFQNKQVWMRNALCVNDFSEIEHGLRCLDVAYHSRKDQFQPMMETMFPGFCKRLEKLFDTWRLTLRTDTYLACVSEHDNSEDQNGRLSMWRAYGGVAGVAIVMNGAPFVAPSDALKAYTNPVSYFSESDFVGQFDKLVARIAESADWLKSLGEDAVVGAVFSAFRFAALCTKHPGFREEREWRIIYTPQYEKSDHMKRDIHSINGIPQQIYKIPLKDIPEEGLTGIELPALVDRVIIGPSEQPYVTYQALVTLLEESGVKDARDKVVVSDIPLRQN